MSNTQYIDGGVTQFVWKPPLIRLTAPDTKSTVVGTRIYLNPAEIMSIRRIPIDAERVLREEVTYVRIIGDGVYVKESPEEVNRLRDAALEGKTTTFKVVE